MKLKATPPACLRRDLVGKWRSALVISCLLGLAPGSLFSAHAQDTTFSSLVGEWDHIATGENIQVRPNGDVWQTSGPMARVAAGIIEAGGNFAFEGKDNQGRRFRCVYYITFLADGTTNWRTVAHEGSSTCPSGIHAPVKAWLETDTGRPRQQITAGPNAGSSSASTPTPCADAGTHWRSAEAIGTLAAYEDHLAQFPACAFAGLAKVRIASLGQQVPLPAQSSLPRRSPDPSQPPVTSAPPSFDCDKSLPLIEQRICDSPGLATKDRSLTILYSRLADSLSGDEKLMLRNEQRQWLKRRRDCGAFTSDKMVACASRLYDERISQLQQKLSRAAAGADPSFECQAGLSPDESAVCADANLAAKDRLLTDLYTRLRSALAVRSPNELNDLIRGQRTWLGQRRQCHEPRLAACVAALYDQRISNLRAGLARQ
ncbi:MAG: lysozyme inhibitor LprI family protein [Xanthobacteraceae bacterium]